MPDLSGRTLGKYRLLERLGRGGMAEVYRAYQPSLERDAAVKVMHDYLVEDEAFVGRFKREAKAVASLHHPHVVQVYDFDIEGDVYYMVMEYISGETLKARLERLHAEGARLPLAEVAHIFRDLCDALDYAHAQGRVHRDVKPANVMFDGERLVLTDFGLATIVGGTRYTVTGTIMGTPAYMSPEQGRGDPGGPLSDVYSLGVILYEMVTGQVPYDADTPLAIVFKHLNEPLPLPSRIAADVPPAVERVILKALAKSPEDRYQSAGALADALEAAIAGAEGPAEVPAHAVAEEEKPAGVPVPAAVVEEEKPAGVPVPVAVAKPAPRRRWVLLVPIGVAALVIVAAVFVAAFLVLPSLGGDEEPVPTAAAAYTPHPEAVAHYEAGVAALLEDLDSEEALPEFARAIEIDPGFAEAYHMRGLAYQDLERYDMAEADFTRAIELKPDFAEAYHDRGRLYLYDLERLEEALADLDRAIKLNPELARAYVDRARYYAWHGDDPDQALLDLDRALELAPDIGEAWEIRGEIYFYNEQYDLAVADLLRAAEMDPEEASIWEMIGFSYYMIGEYEEATTAYDEAIRILPSDLSLYYGRAFVYLELGDLEAALEDFDRVLLLEQEHGGAYYGRARVRMAAGLYEEAVADLTRVIELGYEDYSWPYFEEDSPYLDRALAYQGLGRTDKALADLSAAIEASPDWYLPYYHRGLLYKEAAWRQEAIADFQMLWELAPDEEWRAIAEEELEALGEE